VSFSIKVILVRQKGWGSKTGRLIIRRSGWSGKVNLWFTLGFFVLGFFFWWLRVSRMGDGERCSFGKFPGGPFPWAQENFYLPIGWALQMKRKCRISPQKIKTTRLLKKKKNTIDKKERKVGKDVNWKRRSKNNLQSSELECKGPCWQS